MYYEEIQLARLHKKKVLINVTSLLDVMFLLLIFFIVSSTFLEQPSIAIDLPSAASATPSRIENYTISITDNGTLYCNERVCDIQTLRETMADLARTKPETTIILKGDMKAPYGVIIEVVDAIRMSGLKKLMAFTKTQG